MPVPDGYGCPNCQSIRRDYGPVRVSSWRVGAESAYTVTIEIDEIECEASCGNCGRALDGIEAEIG